MFVMHYNHTFLTNMFRPLLRPSLGWNYYQNAKVQYEQEYETKTTHTNATTLYFRILIIISLEDESNNGRNMLVRKLWLKHVINSEVQFVGYLHIMDL